ncbi:MAG TPA: hypothetical protein VF538_01590 [Pyrinomonadaceae bacterium]
MRWKLLVITSLAATLAGACANYGIMRALLEYSEHHAVYYRTFLVVEIVPLAITVYSSIFVYRHTARRRKLQAALAGLASFILIHLIAFFTLPTSLV